MRLRAMSFLVATLLLTEVANAQTMGAVGTLDRFRVTMTPTGCGEATTTEYPATQTTASFAYTCGQGAETLAFDLTFPSASPPVASGSSSSITLESALTGSTKLTVGWRTPTSSAFYSATLHIRPEFATPSSGCFGNASRSPTAPGTYTISATATCAQPALYRVAGSTSSGAIGFSGFFNPRDASAGTDLPGRVDFKVEAIYRFAAADGADLAVTVNGPTQTAQTTAAIRAVVTNGGPETAAEVVVVLENSGYNTRVSFQTASRGSCASDGASGFTCLFGPLGRNESAYAEFDVAKTASTAVSDLRATVSSGTSDPSPSDNTASRRTFFRDCGAGPACAFDLCSLQAFKRLALAALAGEDVIDLAALYRLRDEVFARSAAGRRYTELYYAHTVEVARLLATNGALRDQFVAAYSLWKDGIAKLVAGQGSSSTISAAQVAGLTGVLEELKRLGSPALRAVLTREQAALDLPSLAGKTMDQAVAQQQSTAPATVTIPAAASIHGVGGAFFHSDLRVLNPSATSAVTVIARYRCFTGPCPSSLERSFSVSPREMKIYDDVVTSLFAAPETAGAIELVGAVLAESRVYTPEKPAATTGSDVPGLSADEAFAEAVLTSLSRSGFRTNVGVYNPNAEALDVTISLHRPDGERIGELSRQVGARAAVQVNDVFGAAGIGDSVADAYALVKADGIQELFAYATVIDQQSQDSVLVKGRNAKGGEPFRTTIPAAASIHGVPPAFFHSDVRVFNPRPSSVEVTATYRCSTGPCPTATEKRFTVGPGAMAVHDDFVANVFQAPETAGAIELTGDVLVDSRVYTPSRPAPTTGTGIAGLADVAATTEAALLSLSQSLDPAKGFRTNIGIYNPDLAEHAITISLRRPDGSELAKLTRTVPPRSPLQINNVFAAATLTADVPNAYALISGDGTRAFFAYATVIDNQSQDSVYVKGRALRAP